MNPVLWLSAPIAILGLLALSLGLRGRRTDNHPICRKCRFDLIGLAPSTQPNRDREGAESSERPARRPECGADISAPRATRIGNHRRLRAGIALGLLLILSALSAGVAIGWGRATNFNWNTIKPAAWLGHDLKSSNDPRALAAAQELVARARAGTITPSTGAAIDAALNHQLGVRQYFDRVSGMGPLPDGAIADPHPALDPWLAVFDAAAAANAITGPQAIRYLQQGLNPGAKLRTRVAAHAPTSLHCYAADNMGIMSEASGVGAVWKLLSVEAGGKAITVENWIDQRRPQHPFRGAWRECRALIDLEPGDYDLAITWELDVYPSRAWSEPAGSFKHTQRTPLTVLAPATPIVTLRAADDLAAEMAAAITWASIVLDGDRSSGELSIAIELARTPVPIVAAAELRDQTGRHWALGHVESSTDEGPVTESWSIPVPLDLDPTRTLDLVLVPDPDHAANRTIVEQLWARDIVLPGIKIRITADEPSQKQ